MMVTDSPSLVCVRVKVRLEEIVLLMRLMGSFGRRRVFQLWLSDTHQVAHEQ